MPTYAPGVFDRPDLESARQIILTQERELDTETRWTKETPHLVDLVTAQLGDLAGRLVLDYGCGVGRVAKALIERTGCAVLGVDSSARMRGLAADYEPDPAFSVVSPQVLRSAVRSGLRVDAALSVWVLQHCLAPAEDLDLISSALAPGGQLFVVNSRARAVPTDAGWASDGLDVRALLRERLVERASGVLDPGATSEHVSKRSFWAAYAQR